ncbi:unnamed protein product [Vitrella brassicaformis CCMP3155]|uniref:hydroxyacylglutathione hydrolase n=2 Tax=Vitrella brassicaformis TaxID=1169539 RepID=A0A0G4FIB7_VITBC|nr:unnamed protein product [Vitrella brassicaformis CCMP3155]|eukprot:CEM12845.1 unnamed protein product [Vitrella brassicaformis CCMP3155]
MVIATRLLSACAFVHVKGSLLQRRPVSRCMATAAAQASAQACADVIPVPLLTGTSNNYGYLLVDRETKRAACVDPVEPKKLLSAAADAGATIDTLLCTHKHWDHSGGNKEMASLVPGIEVISTAYEDIPAVTKTMKDGDTHQMGSLTIKALHTPCHTRGHILFYVTKRDSNETPILFTGDTLFVCGCGRFFEGEASEMFRALKGVIGSLPPETKLYCGHEYTRNNVKFALSVDPANASLQSLAQWVDDTLKKGAYTVPSTIQQELSTNPFMRVDQPALIQAARAQDMTADESRDVFVMKRLREMKDSF